VSINFVDQANAANHYTAPPPRMSCKNITQRLHAISVTFFAVVLVVMKSESIMTGALVATDSVLTDVLTSAIVRRTLVFIYRPANTVLEMTKGRRR